MSEYLYQTNFFVKIAEERLSHLFLKANLVHSTITKHQKNSNLALTFISNLLNLVMEQIRKNKTLAPTNLCMP